MISLLTGRVHEKRSDSVIVDVGGVGYEVAMATGSLASLPAEGDTVTLHTYLQLRDDGAALFGFEDAEDKALFGLLIGVSGVGPKVALSALSALAPAALKQAIAREDDALIASTPGIGKKTAQRIIIELKDKLDLPDLASAPSSAAPDAYAEASDALGAMGFAGGEIARALTDAEGDSLAAEDLVRHALRRLGGAA